jgi:hypothetical protein
MRKPALPQRHGFSVGASSRYAYILGHYDASAVFESGSHYKQNYGIPGQFRRVYHATTVLYAYYKHHLYALWAVPDDQNTARRRLTTTIVRS